MYSHGYSLLLKTTPGDRLNERNWNAAVGAFRENQQLYDLLYISEWDRVQPDDVEASWLQAQINKGDVSAEDFEAFCRNSGLKPYNKKGEILPAAATHFSIARYGEGMFHVFLPRSEKNARKAYVELVQFARTFRLVMTGHDGTYINLDNPGDLPADWDEVVASWQPATLPGFFMSFAGTNRSGHIVGGSHAIRGAHCPNCDLPLMLHLTLRSDDKRLGLSRLRVRKIPLLYCLRCNIFEDDFIYRIINASEIEILKYTSGDDYSDQWVELVGVSEFPRRSFALLPIKPDIQALFDKMNRWCPAPEDKYSEKDEQELANLLTAYDDKSIQSGYRHVVNQIGGRPYLYQGLMYPDCAYCKQANSTSTRMVFLANLVNDNGHDFIIARDVSEYIYFFICPDCRTVHVENRCT